jgi:hypothetical protein
VSHRLTIPNDGGAQVDEDGVSSAINGLQVFVQLQVRQVVDVPVFRVPDLAAIPRFRLEIPGRNRAGRVRLPEEDVGTANLVAML